MLYLTVLLKYVHTGSLVYFVIKFSVIFVLLSADVLPLFLLRPISRGEKKERQEKGGTL